MGAGRKNTLTETGRGFPFIRPSQAVLDCGESGSTLRFLIPTAAAGGVRAEFTGRGRLPERPIGVYLDCLPQAGVACRTQGGLPLSISGALRPGVFRLPGNISSQFITGLLLALPILNGGSEIRLTSPLESAGYVDMTIEMMKRFGVTVTPVENGWLVPGNQSYVPRDLAIEGDWSQAAFFLAAGALSQAQGSSILLRGKALHTGDPQAFSLFQEFGAKLSWEPEGRISRGLAADSCIDASQIPDLVPITRSRRPCPASLPSRGTGCESRKATG
ncbi:MAG: 3-phosphoshikimate 1-carboxyvinyltransferase [[Clostridium] leptum]